MKTIITFLALFLIYFCSYSQINLQKKSPYHLWIAVDNENYIIPGYLYEAKDSSIVISKYNVLNEYEFNSSYLTVVHVKNIEHIIYRSSSQKRKAAWIGLGIGAAIGIISHLNEPEAFGLIYATGLGLGLGLAIGSKKKKISIKRNCGDYSYFFKDMLKENSIKEIKDVQLEN